MSKIPVLLLVIGFLSACVRVPRTAPVTETPVPEAWAGGETTGDSLRGWWTTFGDPGLEKAVLSALRFNHDLRAAAARFSAAAAHARMAGADLYPALSARGSASRQKRNFVGFPFPGGLDGGLSRTSDLFGLSLDVSWEVDLWGRLSSGRAAALADLQASRADLEGFRLSLANLTARTWFASQEARLQVELAESTVRNDRITNGQVRARYRRGLRPSLDVRLSESNLAAAEAELAARRETARLSTRRLEVLLGRYPAADLKAPGDLPALTTRIPGGLPGDIIRRRPDLVAAERRLAAARVRVREAGRALYPRLTLTGSAGTSSDELKNLLNGDFSIWSLAAGLLQPIFQGGRLRAVVAAAEAAEAENLAGYAQAVLNAYAEVESALTAESSLLQQEEALRTAADQALAARGLAEDRYARGLSPLLEVLEAQARAFESQSRLLSVRRRRLDNRVNLYAALGGGFIQPLPNEAPGKKGIDR